MSSRVIYKYQFETSILDAPQGDVVLVANQGDEVLPTIWIEHSPLARHIEYIIRGTGDNLDYEPNVKHVGSAICGIYVWHVYARV